MKKRLWMTAAALVALAAAGGLWAAGSRVQSHVFRNSKGDCCFDPDCPPGCKPTCPPDCATGAKGARAQAKPACPPCADCP